MTSKFEKYIGQKIAKLEILSISSKRDHNKTYFNCKCECGTIRTVNASKLIRGVVKGCQKCKNLGESNPKWKGYYEMTGTYLKNLRNYSRNRKGSKAEFTVSMDYIWSLFLNQERKCALSGQDIWFGSTHRCTNTASLDRIDSSKGYIEGNLQWVHKDVNKMKTDFSQEKFIELCKKVTQNQKA